jgi:hypothetical protein
MEQDCADTWLIVLICEARITWFPVAELMTVIRFYAGWVNQHWALGASQYRMNTLHVTDILCSQASPASASVQYIHCRNKLSGRLLDGNTECSI